MRPHPRPDTPAAVDLSRRPPAKPSTDFSKADVERAQRAADVTAELLTESRTFPRKRANFHE